MNQDNLSVTILQSDLAWEDAEQNLAFFSEQIRRIEQPTDIIILPEMFTTGFSMKVQKLAEEMEGTSMKWMADRARERSCVVAGSLMIRHREHFFNRLIWMLPDGQYLFYDKAHLFRMQGENEYFTRGTEKKIMQYRGWRFCPLICYDLRFPVWSRYRADYDVLIYVANWPESRREVWKTLLSARSIENQSYVIGVNRIGSDGEGNTYSGDSGIYNPRGQIISDIPTHQESVFTTTLSLTELNQFRKRFPVYDDADPFKLK